MANRKCLQQKSEGYSRLNKHLALSSIPEILFLAQCTQTTSFSETMLEDSLLQNDMRPAFPEMLKD
ncbi:unnamed protein product [Acanthoscelides obtectus]|uniref:Uncharacterized protein n=1 Tax=Acanthoscelides obtectus TaxID=200917 RepID=A0A9P0LDR0_ACAOB|nr:unnamed protein product [Acanthoscelides obtectus]CAK1626055.1 hypothetical protein AOBTE_LOCUS3569 [Acanthoscelides obtectus]